MAAEKAVELEVTYWGGDANRTFDILADGQALATVELTGSAPREYLEKRYPIPASVLAAAQDGRITIKFAAKPGSMTGNIYDIRLMKSGNH